MWRSHRVRVVARHGCGVWCAVCLRYDCREGVLVMLRLANWGDMLEPSREWPSLRSCRVGPHARRLPNSMIRGQLGLDRAHSSVG